MFLPIGLEHRVGPLQKEHSHKRTINHNNNNTHPPKQQQSWNNKYTNHLIFIYYYPVCMLIIISLNACDVVLIFFLNTSFKLMSI